jgi:aquaporin NIP
MLRTCLAELFGTFILVFAGTGSMIVNDVSHGQVTSGGVCAVWGLVVMAMIYAFGDISGAHINPAATFTFYLAGRFPRRKVLPYLVSQFAGAILASLVLRLLFGPHSTLGGTHPAGPWWQSFVLEIFLTWILMFVVLQVATGPKETGVLAGIAVGGVVAFDALFAGPICGASMNPARSFAPDLVACNFGSTWIYMLAPLLGAMAAVFSWRCIKE